MNLIADASMVVSALTDDGTDGRWAADVLAAGRIAAPHLLPAEVASTLRRAVLAGALSLGAASRASRDLERLDVELFPYAPFRARVWALRDNLTPYDAWYVAVAEELRAPLATLDERMVRSPGTSCAFLTPDREADPGAGPEPDGGQGRRPT